MTSRGARALDGEAVSEDRRAMSLRASLERLRTIEFESADEGFERYQIAPAATDAQRAAVHAHLGSLPADLDELLRLTSGVTGWGIQLDLTSWLVPPFGLSTTPTLRLSDTLEGWYLDASGEECRTWWFGTDPYDVILGPPLGGWLERQAAYAEALRTSENDGDEPLPPQHPEQRAALVTREAFLEAESDREVLAWARSFPDLLWFFDLRISAPMTEASREAIEVPGYSIAPVAFRRAGRVVAAALRTGR